MQAETTLTTASLWTRFGALLIDGVISVGFSVAVRLALSQPLFSKAHADTFAFYAPGIFFGLAYSLGFLIAKSATPGKLVLGICVTGLDGRRVSPGQALTRYLVSSGAFVSIWGGTIGTGILGLFQLLSCLIALKDPERRAIHDRIAGTRVIIGKPRPIE